jgi:DNA-binding NarL/FixJ family response regulator
MLTRSPEDGQREGALTQRDHTLLRLLAAGYNNKQIANELALAESTVKNNLSALFQKIGVRDRTQAVLYAFQEGLVTRPMSHV